MTFVRYALVGGTATSTHYLILLGLVEAVHITPTLAAAMGAVSGALLAYAGNRRYTFPDCTRSHRAALLRFLLVATLGVGINAGVTFRR